MFVDVSSTLFIIFFVSSFNLSGWFFSATHSRAALFSIQFPLFHSFSFPEKSFVGTTSRRVPFYWHFARRQTSRSLSRRESRIRGAPASVGVWRLGARSRSPPNVFYTRSPLSGPINGLDQLAAFLSQTRPYTGWMKKSVWYNKYIRTQGKLVLL